MTSATDVHPRYTLGSDDSEIARLDAQARMLAAPTDMLLRAAGVGTGMRVLDLGTGLGHVALAVAELVGSTGTVIGVDSSSRMLEVADRRRADAALGNVEFREGDVRTFAAAEPFDAVVGRLILFHLPDAVEVVRHHARGLARRGRVVALDYDIGTVRTEPHVALLSEADAWIRAAFTAGGANPVVGARLGPILRAAGLADVTTFGIQRYFPPDDPGGPALIAGVLRSLAPKIVAEGIATDAEMEPATFEQRLSEAIRAADAVFLMPDLVVAWGTRAGERYEGDQGAR